ncbi:hypothetical protein HQP31_19740 [Rhodococcus fascians]|nr:hypothetical protein [Rhodococcus fascians]MBY3877193.1 hypothetical protein [Rhodococcus fascians]MBY3881657.1 hypothetical protein [Rhodococcus fascians]MBY3931455.1 hypothetical protein [Rhodococcus fascians]MBY3941755.1 hypothetical protein [Rhodococcus fascians]
MRASVATAPVILSVSTGVARSVSWRCGIGYGAIVGRGPRRGSRCQCRPAGDAPATVIRSRLDNGRSAVAINHPPTLAGKPPGPKALHVV